MLFASFLVTLSPVSYCPSEDFSVEIVLKWLFWKNLLREFSLGVWNRIPGFRFECHQIAFGVEYPLRAQWKLWDPGASDSYVNRYVLNL